MKYYGLTFAGLVLAIIAQHLSDVPDMLVASVAVGGIGGWMLGHVAARAADH